MSDNDLSNYEPVLDSPCELFIDASRGVAGDMLLASLIDLGAPLEKISETLSEVLPPHRLEIVPENRRGIVGLGVRVTPLEKSPPHRTLPDLLAALEHPALPDSVRQSATSVYNCLAVAESQVHGIPLNKVHFHEVGAIDAQVDILGVLLAIHHLAPRRISASHIPLGNGQVKAAHGLIPVPAPAVVELLKKVPVIPGPEGRELTTPTGAALVVTLAKEYCSAPTGELRAQGWGYGQRIAPSEDPLNVVRILQTHASNVHTFSSDNTATEITQLETLVDHLSGEELGGLVDRCLTEGALDAFLVPVQMKKSRPGQQLTVLVKNESVQPLCEAIHRWTGSLGIRISTRQRSTLRREFKTLEFSGVSLQIKLAWLGNELISARPEQDDVEKLSQTSGLSRSEIKRQLAGHIEALLGKTGLTTSSLSEIPEKLRNLGNQK